MADKKQGVHHIEVENIPLNGADPGSWGAVASIKSLGFDTKLPEPQYHCTNCRETFMRTYTTCPDCQEQGTIEARQQSHPE